MDKELSKDAKNASFANLTAVEWLVKELNLEGYDYTVDQAKEIERKQIECAYNDGAFDIFAKGYKSMHDYYNKNYGGNNGKN
jgi:hypothetical protein